MLIQEKSIVWIPVIFADLPDANSTTVEVLVKAWSIYEQRETNGLSHFLEHMFFKGGEKYPTPQAVAETIDAFGGEFNAFTGEEYAGYYVKCAPENIFQSIDVLADMLVDARFPQDELEREKGVIIQEIKMYEDMPHRQVIDKRKTRYYGDNSFGWSILWPIENIHSFTPQHFFDHKQNLYTKDNLVIVIAGDISNQVWIEEHIASLFDRLPTARVWIPPLYQLHLPIEHSAFYDKKTQQNHLVISAQGRSMHDDERYAASLLATILGGTMSSRLFMEIREKRWLCYYINAAHNESDNDGLFFIRAWMEKARREEWLQAIHDQLIKISTWDVSDDELTKAVGNITGKTKMGIETSDQLAHFVGEQWLFKKEVQSLEEMLAAYQAVPKDQIIACAENLSSQHLYSYWIQ